MTSNGNALHAFAEDAADYMLGLDALEYYRLPLPSEVDLRVLQIVERFRVSSAKDRATILAALPVSQKSLFGLFAHRAATLAVREESNDWLEAAFLATVIANQTVSEDRNIEVPLAVLHHCALKLGRIPTDLFDWAAAFAADPLAMRLEDFGRRDVTLKKYGWIERRTPEGVRFSFQMR